MTFEFLSESQLATIYIGLLGLSVLLYAILDGYDLGVGVLLPSDNQEQRDRMIASIGPYWDANETWLVLAIGLLLIAFPTAHSLVLQALYIPATIMLAGLILRGVSFDFRAKVKQGQKAIWDKCFKAGSLITTLAQGYMLGLYVTGLETSIWAHGFAVLSALGVTAAYAFIGACWLILKTEHDLQLRAYAWAKTLIWVLGAGIIAVSLANLSLHDFVRDLWLSTPSGLFLGAIPLICFSLLVLCGVVLRRLPNSQTDNEPAQGEWLPFLIAILVFLLSFMALAMSYFPYAVPGQLTIYQSLSSADSLRFLLVGVVFVVPCILAYTFLVYRIFSGKAEQLRYY
ncbi:cytochrome d ubiquinol oxidase subunit II [Psychrosphaera ytuae]|uniref:Cytochrome d ubiquinol oxidase subunit II n=1 Tax=Psychrosphaera ytuae TaxID=2820710 RepID=A0A975HH52_9GAMM|nr:cytochrome d ubiquinol oxidase subunit II [Psychrosphaera ytuae]QTH62668.1 cytochrome d ubiquinol oxidase subunit II [Psychrosphaera ytuae]